MSEVKVVISAKDEIALMARFGRRRSLESLVKRAVTEVLQQQAEDIPIFVTKEEHEAKLKAAETQRAAEDASRTPAPEVVEILARFRAGEKFIDLEGREISDLQPANAHIGNPENLPLMASFSGDNAEWHPVRLDELKPAKVVGVEFEEIPDAPEQEAANA